MSKRLLIIKLICFVTISLFATAASGLMKALSTEQLTTASDIIIRGEVAEVKAGWSKDKKTIHTTAEITVTEVIKGRKVGQTVTVRYRGGEAGDTGLRVSDTADSEKTMYTYISPGETQKGHCIRTT